MDLEDEVKSENMFSESDEILDGLDELEGDETSEQNLEEIGPEHIIDDPEQQEENIHPVPRHIPINSKRKFL